jgi:hypothetical protein
VKRTRELCTAALRAIHAVGILANRLGGEDEIPDEMRLALNAVERAREVIAQHAERLYGMKRSRGRRN